MTEWASFKCGTCRRPHFYVLQSRRMSKITESADKCWWENRRSYESWWTDLKCILRVCAGWSAIKIHPWWYIFRAWAFEATWTRSLLVPQIFWAVQRDLYECDWSLIRRFGCAEIGLETLLSDHGSVVLSVWLSSKYAWRKVCAWGWWPKLDYWGLDTRRSLSCPL